MQRTRVKVCCISSIAEAELAVSHGADALGLLGDMSASPRGIDADRAREIALNVPPTVETFLLSAAFSAAEIARSAEYCQTTAVQIVQHIDVREHQQLVEEIPHIRRVQVIHVESRTALDLINKYAPFVDAFILDGGSAGGHVADLGGTGRVHDWEVSAEFVQRSSKPVFLAGGLTSNNVQEAISTVAPFGVDVCSGVRRHNALDAQQLDEFTNKVWGDERTS